MSRRIPSLFTSLIPGAKWTRLARIGSLVSGVTGAGSSLGDRASQEELDPQVLDLGRAEKNGKLLVFPKKQMTYMGNQIDVVAFVCVGTDLNDLTKVSATLLEDRNGFTVNTVLVPSAAHQNCFILRDSTKKGEFCFFGAENDHDQGYAVKKHSFH